MLAWNSILNENAGETISVSPLKMSRVLLRVACSAERKRERKLEGLPVRLRKNFSLFRRYTVFAHARDKRGEFFFIGSLKAVKGLFVF